MTRSCSRAACLLGLAAMLAFLAADVHAAIITADHVYLTSGKEVPSGNGNLDLVLFGHSLGGGVNRNVTDDLNVDDANTLMPGGSATSLAGAYVTSIGELRAFYRHNFPNGTGGSTVNHLALMVDINESGQVNNILLRDLRIVVDFDPFPGDDIRNNPAAYDIDSDTQNSTSSFSGGSVLAWTAGPMTLPLNAQGGGWADVVIFTGFNPFDASLSDSSRILFYWESTDHDNGGDAVFLSGSYHAGDIPEPATFAVMLAGLALAVCRRRRA